MIIILGFDNTGKTTLAQKLSIDLRKTIVPSCGIKSYEEQLVWTTEQIDNNSGDIYERFTPFEEMVYGPIFRKVSNFDFEGSVMNSLMLASPTIIYCRPDQETVFGTLADRPQMLGVEKFKQELLTRFDTLAFKLFSSNQWKVLVYDWTDERSYKKLLEELKND